MPECPLLQKKFRFETIPCPLCGAHPFKVLGRKAADYYGQHSWHETAQIVRCHQCRLIYANPMPFPEKDDLSDLYNEHYTEIRMLSNLLPYRDLPRDYVDIFEAHRRLQRLEVILGRKGRLLDIGCGPGNLLCVARERGWEVVGLEMNEDSARFAREVNTVEVKTGTFQDCAESWAARFDAIHFNQVLEHLYEPIEFLKAVRHSIRPDGAIFCGVPNEDSLMNNIAHLYFKLLKSPFTPMLSPTFPPYHVLGFSPTTIQKIFHKTQFNVLYIEHVNYSRVDLKSFRNRQVLKGLKSVIGSIARFFGHGFGLDIYAIPV